MIFLLSVLVLSCDDESKIPNYVRFSDTISLFSTTGCSINSDTLRFGNSVSVDLFQIIDSTRVKTECTYSTKRIYGSFDDSIFNDNSVPKFDSFTIFSQSITFDSVFFEFNYVKPGNYYEFEESIKDSLKLYRVSVKYPGNANLDNKIRIGDSYERIFLDYIQRDSANLKVIMPIYTNSQKRITFGINNADSLSDSYMKIDMIEITKK